MIIKKWIPKRKSSFENKRERLLVDSNQDAGILQSFSRKMNIVQLLDSFDKETEKLHFFREWLLQLWWQHRYLTLSDTEPPEHFSETWDNCLKDTEMNSVMRHTIEQYERVRMLFEEIPSQYIPRPGFSPPSEPALVIMFPQNQQTEIPVSVQWEVAYRNIPFSSPPQIYTGTSNLENILHRHTLYDVIEQSDNLVSYDIEEWNILDIISDWEMMKFDLDGLTTQFLKRNRYLPDYPGDEKVSRYSPMRLARLLGFEDDDKDFLDCTGNEWYFNPYISTDNEVPFGDIHQGFLGITNLKFYSNCGKLLKYPASPMHDADVPVVVRTK